MWSRGASAGDQILDVAAVEWGDEGPAHRSQHLAGDTVGIVFELVDALAKHRGLVAAAQHLLQRQRALKDGLRVPRKQVEKPLFPRQKGTKPAQHGLYSIVVVSGRGRPSQNCHRPISEEKPRRWCREPAHPPFCKARNAPEMAVKVSDANNARSRRSRR